MVGSITSILYFELLLLHFHWLNFLCVQLVFTFQPLRCDTACKCEGNVTYINTFEVSLLTALRVELQFYFFSCVNLVNFTAVMLSPQRLALLSLAMGGRPGSQWLALAGGGLTWCKLSHITAKRYTKEVSFIY